MVDWARMKAQARGVITRTMGEDLSYLPASGGTFPLRGVFSAQFVEVDPETGHGVTSNTPNVFCSVEHLPGPVNVEGDHLRRESDGQLYLVKTKELDGEGGVRLFMHEVDA